MGFTTFYQQKQMQATQQAQAATASPQMQQTQMMMTRFLPAMLMVFSFTFPSGLVVYWLATNLWTIVQQRIILRAVPLELGAPAGSPSASGTSTVTQSRSVCGRSEHSSSESSGGSIGETRPGTYTEKARAAAP